MRHYHIYLIEDEIAQTYFGEESKLFQLFLEAEHTNSPLKVRTLKKQISYITKPILIPKMDLECKKFLEQRSDYQVYPNFLLLDLGENRGQAKLSFSENHILISSLGGFEAETIFFEVLRQLERCFLAMDFNQHRYGWLNPIKQAYYI